MLGKCNQLSQPREHDAKIQITHAELYKESDNLFLNKYFLTMHIDNQSIQRMIPLIEYVKYSCLMKTKF